MDNYPQCQSHFDVDQFKKLVTEIEKHTDSVEQSIKLNGTIISFLERIQRLKAYEKANDVCVLIPEIPDLKAETNESSDKVEPVKRSRVAQMLEMASQEEG